MLMLSAAGGGVTLDFDYTVVFQMGIFVLLMFLLEPLLFRPVLRIFALREERTEGVVAQARDLEERAGELLTRYEKELERVHRAAAVERERIRQETTALETKILHEAREATTKILEDGRRRIETEVTRIRFDLGRESEQIAGSIVQKTLGGETA
ncbi:MAG TPA: ATP synthase F0 subunit B [Polyangiaceae bacterium]|nr:ATP synthase F0 subunit B [Polyangiaceae bacterium]